MFGAVNEYTYDAAGNLINSGTSDIGGHSYTYNALNQITAVDGGTTASYLYNGSDERTHKITSSGWTDYVHFESIGSDGRTITENSHVGITNP